MHIDGALAAFNLMDQTEARGELALIANIFAFLHWNLRVFRWYPAHCV
jgi:hypothetical protein